MRRHTGPATFTIRPAIRNDTTARCFFALRPRSVPVRAGTINGTVSDSTLDSWTLEIASGSAQSIWRKYSNTRDRRQRARRRARPLIRHAAGRFLHAATDGHQYHRADLDLVYGDRGRPLTGNGVYQRHVRICKPPWTAFVSHWKRDYSASGHHRPVPDQAELIRRDGAQVNVPTTGLESFGVFAPFAETRGFTHASGRCAHRIHVRAYA